MRFILVAAVCWISLLPPARAQDADDAYIAIYGAVQQAENLADTGEPKAALASLLEVQAQLQKFQKIYPDWNPTIVNYRLNDLARVIALVNARLAAATPPPAETPAGAPSVPTAKSSAQERTLRAQLQSLQAENESLQARLKEALSTQPAAIDSGDLAKAQEQIRSLMKENDLLTTGEEAGHDTNGASALRRRLADALEKRDTEHARGEKLAADNAALRQQVKAAAGQESDALEMLRSQNRRLKSEMADLQAATNGAARTAELPSKLKAANRQINSLQSSLSEGSLERTALENKVKQLSAQLDILRAPNYEARVHELTAERDELAKRLASAGAKTSPKKKGVQVAALTDEVQALRARLAVDEAKPAPYSAEELALLQDKQPDLATRENSPSSPPPQGQIADLVASARRHFAQQDFAGADADYQKILKHTPRDAVALANLATIELQENKLPEAEQHINAALAASPNDSFNLSTLGVVKIREEKYDEALDVLSRAAQLDPHNPEIQNHLGLALGHKGLRAQAEAALRKAIEINPEYGPAHNNLAMLYLDQTPPMPSLALWHYQKAIAAGEPRSPEIERLLAEKGAPVTP